MSSGWTLPNLVPGRKPTEQERDHRTTVNGHIAQFGLQHRDRTGIPRRVRNIHDVPCYELGDPNTKNVVIYLHGGGYRVGEAASWVRYAAGLAEDANVRVVIPDYRLAPEYPFPAALYDSAAVYRVIAEETRDGSFFLVGESAGAHLTPSTILAAIANGARLPDGAIMISPWVDLSNSSPTYHTHAEWDTQVSQESVGVMRALFLQDHYPIDHPLVSPLKGELSKFPPTQIYCGGHEVLLGDALEFGAKLARNNRHIEMYVLPGAQHGWSFIEPQLECSQFLRDRMTAFLRQRSVP